MLGEPFAGENMWWSDSGDDLENTMTRPIDLSAATTAALMLKARYEIEAGFDYLYVQASTDSGTTWTSFIRGQNAQPVFDDSRPYWFPEIPQTGVKVPDTGTRIRAVSVDGTSMRIRVSSS